MAPMIEIAVHVPRSDRANEFPPPREIPPGGFDTTIPGRAAFPAVARHQDAPRPLRRALVDRGDSDSKEEMRD